MKDKRDNRDFFEKVFAVVSLIPYGKVTSYGAIARYLGTGSSAYSWLGNEHGTFA